MHGKEIYNDNGFAPHRNPRRSRRIAVVAEVEGRRILPLGEIGYQYPVVVAKELHLWEPSSGPQIFCGIGVSKEF
jgi:outer membrane lipoprotein